MLEALQHGIAEVFTVEALLFIAFGVLWGTVGGIIPGINATIAMALLLPFTYTMDSTVAIMMLAGVYCGGEYGGSIPAVLIGVPGTNAAACTIIDGYPLHKKGRTGLGLYVSLFSSVFGGLYSAAFLVILAIPLAKVALAFGPAEYFALAFLGLSMVCSLGERNVFKGILAGLFGILLSTIGFDTFTGAKRFTFGLLNLNSGISMVALMMGLYAITEMFDQAQRYKAGTDLNVGGVKPDLGMPKWKEIKPLVPWMVFGSTIGTLVGVMPGAGATAAAFLSYNETKRFSRQTGFGEGNPLGVVAPESANNGATGGAMVPLLSLGIPGSNSTAIMLAAFSIHGINAGPMLFTSRPEVPYGLFVSLFVANFFMIWIGWACIKSAMRITSIPKPVLISVIIALVFTGTFAYSGEVFSMYIALIVGILGVVMRKFNVPSAAIVLGFVLGKIMEANLRRALIISRGSYFRAFSNSPLSSILLILAVASILTALYSNLRGKKRTFEI
ncbi:MAG TPA: tripartite tricarboxylate transporter permease [Candidatus Limnocylindria bacterium]|nr:tripartite tricarboxylate transporter permease [Candidatus Limnocylindria bacterium]